MTVVLLAADGSPGSEAAAASLVTQPLFAPPLVAHVIHVSPAADGLSGTIAGPAPGDAGC